MPLLKVPPGILAFREDSVLMILLSDVPSPQKSCASFSAPVTDNSGRALQTNSYGSGACSEKDGTKDRQNADSIGGHLRVATLSFSMLVLNPSQM